MSRSQFSRLNDLFVGGFQTAEADIFPYRTCKQMGIL